MADRIPEGWRECKLGDIITLHRGYDLPKNNMIGGIIPVAGSNGIIGYHNQSTTKGPGVTIGRSGNLGNAFFYNTNFWAHNTSLYVKDFKGNDEKYIYYFLKGLDFSQFNAGSAVPTLNRNHIHSLEIKIPPLPEQRAIASVLGSLDDKIDLLNRENQTLEHMAEAIFRQWFIEEADEKWEEGTIANMMDILPGFPFRSDSFTELGKYCLITIKSVQDGQLEISKTDKIYDIPSKMPNYCQLKPGDILLSLTGNVGRCCLVDVNNALLNQRVAKLLPKNSRDMAYTYIYFRMEKTKRLLEEMAKGTAQPNLSPVETLRIKMRIPPKSKLELFSSKSNPIIKRILCNKIQIRTLEKLRNTLLPKLMSGEVRVKLTDSEVQK